MYFYCVRVLNRALEYNLVLSVSVPLFKASLAIIPLYRDCICIQRDWIINNLAHTRNENTFKKCLFIYQHQRIIIIKGCTYADVTAWYAINSVVVLSRRQEFVWIGNSVFVTNAFRTWPLKQLESGLVCVVFVVCWIIMWSNIKNGLIYGAFSTI